MTKPKKIWISFSHAIQALLDGETSIADISLVICDFNRDEYSADWIERIIEACLKLYPLWQEREAEVRLYVHLLEDKGKLEHANARGGYVPRLECMPGGVERGDYTVASLDEIVWKRISPPGHNG